MADTSNSRIPFFNLPSIQVPVEQITDNKDVITKEYADANYAAADSVQADSLPAATATSKGAVIVGTTLTISEDVLDVNKVTSVTSSSTDVQIATAKAVYTFASNASNLASGTVAVARLPKANGTGSNNAGAVYVADANQGLTAANGALKVNFASFSTWDSSDAASAVTPAYVKAALADLSLEKSTVVGGTLATAGFFVRLDETGHIDPNALPSIAITDTFTASSQAGMLALTEAKKGDICIRTDVSKTYILAADGYSTLSNWKEILTPTDAVSSVNGQTGAVTQAQLGLVTTIGNSVNNTDTSFPSSKAVMSYVTGYAATVSHSHSASDITEGTLSNDRLNKATATALGIASFDDDNFTVTNGVVSLNPAGATTLGGVKVTAGNGLTYNNETGALSVSLATASAAGAVKVTAGNGLAYNTSNGTISMGTASDTAFGAVKIGPGLSASAGTVSLAAATDSALGGVMVASGNGLSYSSNKISVSLANGSTAGTVKQGTGITIASGAVSVNFATSSNVASNLTSDVLALTPKGLTAAAIDTFSSSASGRVIKTNSSGKIDADFVDVDPNTLYVDGGVLYVMTDGIADALNISGLLSKSDAESGYLSLEGAGVEAYESKGYTVGDVVAFNGKLYRCIQAHTSAQTPVLTTGYWALTTLTSINTFKTTIGNNASSTQTDFVITHNLSDQDVTIKVIDDDTDVEVFVAIEHTSENTATIKFGTAPAAGKVYRVVCRR